jgi:hypothetical protein
MLQTLPGVRCVVPAESAQADSGQRRIRMFSKKLLLLLAMTMVSGTLAGSMTTKKKDCIPCTAYCKTHPNAPRCN